MVPSQVFEIVVRRYQRSVRAFLTQLTGGDSMLADDLAQETFIKAFYAWDTFQALSSAKTWLFRIAYNTFYDYNRSHHMTEDIDEVDVDCSSAEEKTDKSDLRFDLSQAMLLLSEAERTCVQLAVVEDLPIKRVVQVTGMNENTVKSHIKRGKEKLKTYLKNNGYDR